MKTSVAWMLLASSLTVGPRDLARAETAGVGIDEKLGQTIPLDLALVDERGAPVTLRQIVEKPTVLTLNYFRCGGICTPQLNNLARTLNEIDREPGRDFQVVTVSFDERDTPAVAAEKRRNYLKLMRRPFPPDAWRFLTGQAASTRALADAVGIGFKRQDDAFVHPGAAVILSPHGLITRYLYGVSYLTADVAMAVDEASNEQVRPTISRMLSFCFSYDPAGRRYVLDATRLAGVIVLALAGALLAAVLLAGRRAGRNARGSS